MSPSPAQQSSTGRPQGSEPVAALSSTDTADTTPKHIKDKTTYATPRYKRLSSKQTYPGDADFNQRMIAETDGMYCCIPYADFMKAFVAGMDQDTSILNEAAAIIKNELMSLNLATCQESETYPPLVSFRMWPAQY
jgi:protein-tyrosine phosphatase